MWTINLQPVVHDACAWWARVRVGAGYGVWFGMSASMPTIDSVRARELR